MVVGSGARGVSPEYVIVIASDCALKGCTPGEMVPVNLMPDSREGVL